MTLTYKEKYNKKYKLPKGSSNSMVSISRKTGISKNILQQVFNRGIGAFKTNPGSVRKGITSPEQWGYARVYSFIMGGRTQSTADKDLWDKR